MEKIPIAHPYIPEEAKEAVKNTLSTRWVGQGPKVDEFEKAFERKFGVKNAVAVNSGTSALELAYDLLGIGPGDEVITPVLTCTATNLALIRRGVKIVFADIKRNDLTIDYDDVIKKITNRTKAVVAVDLSGIQATREKFSVYIGDEPPRYIPLIVDAAQALGNTGGDFTCYSFGAIKHITTGDGGMLVCKDRDRYRQAKLRRWFGIDRELKISNDWQPYKKRKILFDIEYPGYKFQMNDIAATLGIVGLEHYDEIMSHRRAIFDIYRDVGLPMIDGKNNRYGYASLMVDDRDCFAEYLKRNNIESNVMQVRNDVYKVFAPYRTELPNMDAVDDHYICIPCHNAMTIEDAKYIAMKAREFLHG